ncbi:flavin-containing monooxygenase [Ferrimonas lipolytica]|uniref:NAD(P)/FAD-dependent oxidoreductase n=1 Tax=Ferrimonas lipolytica TaxID=2724191 RepID=A0A6H1UAD8_9GAMM|nr:NAD(P)/FAD-dependent oxidoreductase [Ferrimonas lipolytica]QIZ76025.1 NAD(P)/FAD-dependent oxidoreductase [Ferrimonas lipolytica]
MTSAFDQIIIGAGLSGLGLAHQLKQQRPQDRFIVLESRERVGGTWDLFRYPGIRSDSDMYSYSFSFKPWRRSQYLGQGARIRTYLDELVDDSQLQPLIRFSHNVEQASWSSEQGLWTLNVEHNGELQQLQCKVLISCAGYYNYQQGYRPTFPGQDSFDGVIADPQHWPESLDYRDKKVVVIGSGATAVSIVPEVAKTAASVTMLQRSPSYFFSFAETDWLHKCLAPVLPAKWLDKLMRTKYIGSAQLIYFIAKRWPQAARNILKWQNQLALKNSEQHRQHFSPDYDPWQQRLCILPSNDLFKCIHDKRAQIVTDHIDSFDAQGIQLKSGRHIEADIIVPATGLNLRLWGGMKVLVDGSEVHSGKVVNYKGVMYSQVPNFINIFGYISASWTLRAELSYHYILQLLQEFERQPSQRFYPKWQGDTADCKPMLNLNSGYVQRSAAILPKTGMAFPWLSHDLYSLDAKALNNSPLLDGVLQFEDGLSLCDFHQR